MAKLLKTTAQCSYCRQYFEKGKVFIQRTNGVLACSCFPCYQKLLDQKKKERNENVRLH